MDVVEYQEKYKNDFVRFNTDWITENFGSLEPKDLESFASIDADLQNGAMIFFAVDKGRVLATCMVKPVSDEGVWELCKLASNNRLPHKGAGSAVFEASMNWAARHHAKRLVIISNSKLKAAIHIYRKYGFQEVVLQEHEYARGDIAFEYMVPQDTGTA